MRFVNVFMYYCMYVGCQPCLSAMNTRPNPNEFMHYLPKFVNHDPDTTMCGQG